MVFLHIVSLSPVEAEVQHRAVWDPAPKRHSRAMSHSAWLFWTRNKTLPDHNPGGFLGIVVFISWLQRAVLGEVHCRRRGLL